MVPLHGPLSQSQHTVQLLISLGITNAKMFLFLWYESSLLSATKNYGDYEDDEDIFSL